MWQDVLTENFLRKLDGLTLNARAASRAGTGGQRRSKARGGSVEFADFREYMPGDDTRRIDWSAFARFDKLYIRLFLDERDTLLTIWLDCSASMVGKADRARQLAAALCYLALTRFDRAAVCAVGDGLKLRSEVFSGRAAFHRVVKFIDSLAFSGNTELLKALKSAPPRSGGISVVLSDLLMDTDCRQAISFLKFCRQDVAVLQLLTPEELEPVLEGPTRLVSAEDEPAVDIAASPMALEAYQRVLEAFVGGIKAHCFSQGAAYLLVNTSIELDRLVFNGLAVSGVVR